MNRRADTTLICRRKFNSARKRVESFSKARLPILYKRLALSGFKLWGNYVTCEFCLLRFYNFREYRDPDIFHITYSPSCIHMLSLHGREYIANIAKKQEPDSFICKICNVLKIHCFFKPCFHAVCCVLCYRKFDRCPYCSTRVVATKKIHY